MSEHDHEYTLTVRPTVTIDIAYTTDSGRLKRTFFGIEYGRDGLERDDESDSGIEWRGYEITFARDGRTIIGDDIETTLDRGVERLLGRDVSLDIQRVLRGIDTASVYGRRLIDRLKSVRKRQSGDQRDNGSDWDNQDT